MNTPLDNIILFPLAKFKKAFLFVCISSLLKIDYSFQQIKNIIKALMSR